MEVWNVSNFSKPTYSKRASQKSWLIVGVGCVCCIFTIMFLFYLTCDDWWERWWASTLITGMSHLEFSIFKKYSVSQPTPFVEWFEDHPRAKGHPIYIPKNQTPTRRWDEVGDALFFRCEGKIARNRNTREHKTKDVIVLLAHTILCTSYCLLLHLFHSFPYIKGSSYTFVRISFMFFIADCVETSRI